MTSPIDAVILALVATSSASDAELARRWHREAVAWERLAADCGAAVEAGRAREARLRAWIEGQCSVPPAVELAPSPAPRGFPWALALGSGAVGAALATATATPLACSSGRCRERGWGAAILLGIAGVAILW